MSKVDSIIRSMNLGVSKQTIAAAPDSPLHTLLIGTMQEVMDRLTGSIDKHNIKASNRLKQSITSVDQSEPGVLNIGVSMNFYWKYMQYGVNGTMQNWGAPTWGPAPGGTEDFKTAILGWIRDKGIQARPGQTYDQMAFVIMRSIKEKGIEPRPFYTDVVNDDLKKFISTSISKVYSKALKVEISDPWQ